MKYDEINQHYLKIEWPPPWNHYSDMVSEIPSGSVYIYIWHIYSDILSDILSGIYFDILSDIPPGIYSDILSGIYSNIIASGILSGIYSDTLSRILSDILSGVWLRSGSAQWDLALAAEVQCPLRSGARGWGPAVPTEIWRSWLRSSSAHCCLQRALKDLEDEEKEEEEEDGTHLGKNLERPSPGRREKNTIKSP